MLQVIKQERIQIGAFASLSAGVMAFTALACINHINLFRKFLDFQHPEWMVFLSTLLGLFAIVLLMKKTPFLVLCPSPQEGILWGMLLALPFGIVIILIDLLAPFPEDIALPLPVSLLIYPAMGFVAEMIFHILPLTFLFLVLRVLFRKVRTYRIIGFSILVAAFLESIYHMVNLSGYVQFSLGVLLLVGFHILLFSLSQLMLFRRYDFFTMYAFRMTYYLIWHIAWGTFRLTLLF